MSGLFVELRDRIENREARAHRTLGIVVMRRGPPEISHHAVAEILRDVPAEPRYRFRRGALEAAHGLAPFLGIELSRDRGRADEIAEQHRQMPPLTYFARLNTRRLRDWRAKWCIERSATFIAELCGGRVIHTTVRTGPGKSGSAFRAELCSGR